MIPTTRPFLPPQKEYEKYLDGIWQRQWLTNMGPLASSLEMQLKDYLAVKHLLFVTNGTVALQMAIKALLLKGEIITTPFSYVATTSSIVCEGCTPIFVDIDPHSLNIDATKIEASITDRTSAILATHVYGNPCDVVAIEQIAKKHNLKVIYDGAHAFGVKIFGKSIFEYGDISTCSLHATKLYHSIEGGLIITKDSKLLKRLAFTRNFGHDGPDAFAELGWNGKNSEFHAAMGLVNLNYITAIHNKRKELSEAYD
jgi:dTDP-4-amino-4,6-dideoxygalactose transaminase